MLVVEDDRFLRMVGVVLDPTTPKERVAAYADFFAHDERDFEGYCKRVRARAPALYPAQVRLVETSQQMRLSLSGSQMLIVESLPVGRDEISLARDLRGGAEVRLASAQHRHPGLRRRAASRC